METLERIGKYEIIDVLGRGGMGVVYKAMDPAIRRMVAIKMMTVGFAENPDLLRRFYREAQSTGTLQHPNIVIVYELGDQDGNPYLVMEFLEGEGLDKIIASRRPLTMVQRLDVLIQLCNGLNYAHSHGVVHRDIKPANIVVLKDGGVKIVDFGIARIGGDALTRTGQIVGTINYMSPEQVSARVVDGRSDIFSAGVVAFQLLTSALPFDAPDTASMLLKIINEPPPPLSAFISNCPPELEEAVLRALAKDRDERYQTAEDFGFDLLRIRESLKRHLVDQYIEQAHQAVSKSELGKGKELLLEVLKVDTQNLAAKQLLQQVQQLLQKQQRGEQVRQLRQMADSALSQSQHGEALSYLDQALSLDKTNIELKNLRETVQQAKARLQQFEEALRRAESAQQVDDLDAAQAAAAEALRIDANSTRAKALQASLAKEVTERARQKELHDLLNAAGKEISARHFTAAFEMLKQAEALDATAPELHTLLKLATSGREQEARRKELERFNSEIEEALSRDDYTTACARADEALLKFPSEPGLLKIRALAEKQRQAGEKKQYIDEQLTAARALLEGGKAADALRMLETAVQKAPGDTRLLSMLSLMRENTERQAIEERQQRLIRTAKEALRTKAYDKAISVLEEALTEGDSAEVDDLLQFARDEAAQAQRRQRINETTDEAQRLIADDEYERAIALVEEALHEIPDDELRLVLSEARRHFDDFNKKLEGVLNRAQRLLEARKADDAVTMLEAQPKSYAHSPAFCETLKRAHEDAEKWRELQKAFADARAAQARNEFAAAEGILTSCRRAFGELPEIKSALDDNAARRAAAAKTSVERAIRDARMLLLARQYNAARQQVEAVAKLMAFVPAELRTQLETLRAEIVAGAEHQAAGLAKAGRSVTQTGDAGHTAVPEAYAATAVMPPPAAAHAPAGTVVAPAPVRAPAHVPAVVTPKPRRTPMIVASVVVIALLLAVVGYFTVIRRMGAPAATSFVAINAIPWGTVKTLKSGDGKIILPVNALTPVRVAVPAGEYTLVIAGPDGRERSEQVRVARDAQATCTVVFEAIDVDKIISSH